VTESPRVIRIFDEHRLVINVGSDDGVERGQPFGIYSDYDDIIDPTTNESLGSYRKLKATVLAAEVYPKFTVAVTQTKTERVEEEPVTGVLGMMYGARTRTTTRRYAEDLPVETGDLRPISNEEHVKVGDVAELRRTK
jgi:hypothetical protein